MSLPLPLWKVSPQTLLLARNISCSHGELWRKSSTSSRLSSLSRSTRKISPTEDLAPCAPLLHHLCARAALNTHNAASNTTPARLCQPHKTRAALTRKCPAAVEREGLQPRLLHKQIVQSRGRSFKVGGLQSLPSTLRLFCRSFKVGALQSLPSTLRLFCCTPLLFVCLLV